MRYRLAEFRKARGLTQAQLAERLNESRRNIEDWERGKRLPRVDKALTVARFFGVGVEEMFK